jgi:hypothetical protein
MEGTGKAAKQPGNVMFKSHGEVFRCVGKEHFDKALVNE